MLLKALFSGFERFFYQKMEKMLPFFKKMCYMLMSESVRSWWNGRHDGLRSRCRKAWEFKSLRPHHYLFDIKGN